MTLDPTPAASSDDVERAEVLAAQGSILLASDAFGRSQALERLFRFLLACSVEGRSPKEIEIADEVFGRSATSIEQDASIRVYVHRLRRKLDEFHARPDADPAIRLILPKGGYRLAIERMPAAPDAIGEPARHGLSRRRLYELVAVVALLCLAIGVTWWIGARRDTTDPALAQVRASALWSPLLSDQRRAAVVVGDYYIMGQRGADGDVARLVREFDVNSANDLEQVAARDPERARSYVDLGLNYLPVGVGNALRAVVPVLRRTERSIVATVVVPGSTLGPEVVKHTNLVYLGYLSGLGSLRDPTFSGSRFAIGNSYDEIIDRTTGRHYVADTHLDLESASPSQDYALISKYRGVSGNWVIVIAGTRDAALMQAAEYATNPDTITDLLRQAKGADSFDALLAVESLHNVGLRARLIGVSPRSAEADWSGKRAQRFPDDIASETPTPDR